MQSRTPGAKRRPAEFRRDGGDTCLKLGFADAHHPLTHHRGRAELIEKATKIQCHHLAQFASLVKKLKAMKEGDGTVFDRSVADGETVAIVEPPIYIAAGLPSVTLTLAGRRVDVSPYVSNGQVRVRAGDLAQLLIHQRRDQGSGHRGFHL